MSTCFNMNSKNISPGIFKLLSIFFRFYNHQVNIANFFCRLSYKLNDHGPESNIGNKAAIHHIKMKPVGLAFIQHFAIGFKIDKIGRKERGCDDWHFVEFALQDTKLSSITVYLFLFPLLWLRSKFYLMHKLRSNRSSLFLYLPFLHCIFHASKKRLLFQVIFQ